MSESYDPEAFGEMEHAGWEKAAAHYHDLFGATTSQSAGPMLDAVEAWAGARVLDVACGPGRVTAAAHKRGAAAVGLDFSAAMVAEARKHYPEIAFQEGNAEDLPFEAERFDAVVCSFGMHHFPRPGRAVAEARRVLAPGGRFAFTAWLAGSEYNQAIAAAVAAHGDPAAALPPGPSMFSDAAGGEEALRAGGFADPFSRELLLYMRYPDAETVLTLIYKSTALTGKRLEMQPPEAREKIDRAIIENLRAYEKDGGIELTRSAVMVCGRKP